VNTKTGEDSGLVKLPSEESSLKVLEIFGSLKFPFALLIGALAGTVFFLKRRILKQQEMNENLEDFEDLEENDAHGNN
jgi:hypothetical protein